MSELDLVAVDSTPANVPNNIAVLLGNGDGTFQPEKVFQPPSVLIVNRSGRAGNLNSFATLFTIGR